ncbi:ATP cone domain-containing protein [Chitinophaga jiangningensis]|uniref:ATP cone domain-containing protein n=1 Tax=Chitinophaga jiangningensis TaxID=1419482 RepID=A0A1M7C2K8_9BACT|nr:ATP cone domain-containing protein [Chitinophaga jiangningensis]SHL61393.1 ATP cone domain-containing protein [Chitinophaga jiangningensis]
MQAKFGYNSTGMAENAVYVTKRSGETKLFSDEKVRDSLHRAGAEEAVIDEIMKEIHERLYPGISTRAIYRTAFNILKAKSRHVAARYNLKQGIFQLGPSGFPFEKYMAELFINEGFQSSNNIIMQGHCVTHEVDVLATKGPRTLIVECKYHHAGGTFCDVKVPLYFHSRCDDIIRQQEGRSPDYEGWLVTNTRFSTDALQYGNCAGLHLLSWDYPDNRGLKDIIDRTGLYPVTCLTTLTREEKFRLLGKGYVLCNSLLLQSPVLEEIDVGQGRRGAIRSELEGLCKKVTAFKWV